MGRAGDSKAQDSLLSGPTTHDARRLICYTEDRLEVGGYGLNAAGLGMHIQRSKIRGGRGGRA